jgi:signal transduction histidine kinase
LSTGKSTLQVENDHQFFADREWLGNALGAIFSNAVIHTGTRTTVRVGVEDGNLFVEDDGPGIPLEDEDRITVSGKTTLRDGSGYGLTIVEHVALAHDWQWRVFESDHGGVRVEFDLGSVETEAAVESDAKRPTLRE